MKAKKLNIPYAYLLYALISILFLYVLANLVKVNSLKLSINGFYLLLSLLFLILMHITFALRVKYFYSIGSSYLTRKQKPLSLFNAFFAHMFGMLLSEFSPGRAGYWLSPLYLKKKGYSGKLCYFSFISSLPFDMAVKVAVALLGLFALLRLTNPLVYVFVLIVLALFFLAVFSVSFTSFIEKLFSLSLSLFPVPEAFKLSLSSFFSSFFHRLKKVQAFSKLISSHLFELSLFIFFSYLFRVLNWLFLAKALSLSLTDSFLSELMLFFVLQPLLTIAEFLPLPLLAGTGATEGLSILVFSIFGISKAMAFAFSLLVRIESIVVSFAFGIFPFLEFAKKKKPGH